MNKNQIFREFLKNPDLRELIDIREEDLKNYDLYTNVEKYPILEVIKTVLNNLDDETTVDKTSKLITKRIKSLGL